MSLTPENHRRPWTAKADRELRDQIRYGETIEGAAAFLGRSRKATACRLERLGVRVPLGRRPDLAVRCRLLGCLGRGMSITHAAAEMGRHRSNVQRVIGWLLRHGYVVKTGGPRAVTVRYVPVEAVRSDVA